jgi:hypothetical protein
MAARVSDLSAYLENQIVVNLGGYLDIMNQADLIPQFQGLSSQEVFDRRERGLGGELFINSHSMNERSILGDVIAIV